jgi:hypothetical protein
VDRTITVRLVASIGQYQAQMGAAAAQTRGFGQSVVVAAAQGNAVVQAMGKGMLVAGRRMLAEILGHRDTRMINIIYGHLFEKDRHALRTPMSRRA